MNESSGTVNEGSRRHFLSSALTGLAAIPSGLLTGADKPIILPERPAGVTDRDWEGVRRLFARKRKNVFLNNASLGMPPLNVVASVTEGYKSLSTSPVEGKLKLQKQIQSEVLPKLANILGCSAEEFTLTRNASEALHISSMGLNLSGGDEVLITTQEHPAGQRPWKYREHTDGIKVTEVFVPSPLPETANLIGILESAVTPRSRALAFCHITRGGHLYPVAALVRWARSKGLIALIDGAQAVGMIPVNLKELNCDCYSASLHKWMLAPLGTGFLYIRKGSRPSFRSVYDPLSTEVTPMYDPTGTMDLPIRYAVGAALGLYTTLGAETVAKRLAFLSAHLRGQLSAWDLCTLLTGEPERAAPGSTLFEVRGLNPGDALPLLEGSGYFIDEHIRDGHKAFRVSTHYYNTVIEIDGLLETMKSLGDQ